MDRTRETLKKILNKTNEIEKKQLTFHVTSEQISKIDQISNAISIITEKNYSRNSLLEDAIELYYTEMNNYLFDEYGVDIKHVETILKPLPYKKQIEDFDTVVYPGYQDGFEAEFIQKNQWYYVRIKAENIDKIKYIAIYLGKPISAITHYGEVDKYIPSDKYPNKYTVLLKGKPIPLKQKIPLGDISPAATRAPKYTTLEKLKKANEFNDL